MAPKKPKTSGIGRFIRWLLILLVLASLGLGGWLWYDLQTLSPRLNYILLTVNDQPEKILPGEYLSLHPRDRVHITEISTNIPLNLDVRLVCLGIDAEALRYREMRLFRLLPDQNMLKDYRLNIVVNYRDQQLGRVVWNVKPYVDDWIDKVNRTIDKKRRLEILQKACEMFPNDDRLRKRLLAEYQAQGEWKNAAAMIEREARGSKNLATLKTLLKSYRKASNMNGVVSVLKRLIAIDPKDLNSRVELAEILEKRGQLKSAARQYEAILGIVSGKDKLPLYDKLGYLFTKTGNFKKAAVFYQKAAEMDPKDANLFYNLAYLYEKTGEQKTSRRYLEKALALTPGDMDGRMKLAQDLMAEGEWGKAETYLSQVLSRRPKSLPALLLMAHVLDKRGETKALQEVYRRILAVNPGNGTVKYNLGVLEYETGNLKGALPILTEYVKAHPKDAETHRILLDIYRRLKSPDKAYQEALLLTKLGSKDLDTWMYVINHLNSQGDYKQMIPVLTDGLKIHPEATELRNYLIVAYLKTGMEKKAMTEMEEVLKKRPKDMDLLLNLARLKEKYGDYSGALEAYKRVLVLSPNNEEAQNAYLKLRLKVMESEQPN